jgi:Peptidase family M1 domain
LAAVTLALLAQTPRAADLGGELLNAGLDPTACFRVRDLEIDREDAQFYLTEGYLIFGKPVNGAPVSAVFSAEVEGGDGEVLMLPPNRSERKSLAGYTGSPNLDEHFKNAVFLFTDAEARGLEENLRAKAEAKTFPEVGAILADQWSRTVINLTSSFESRMLLDLIAGKSADQKGFFDAIVQGKKLGNFDLSYDGRSYEQLNAGQLTTRGGRSYFDTWTNFSSRSHRNAAPLSPEEEILSYRIDATLDAAFVLHCVTHIRFRAKEDSRNVLPFDLSAQMRATEAKLDGAEAEIYERDSIRSDLLQNSGNELVLVIPPQPLEPGSEHEVEIHHDGKVVLDAGHQVYFVSSRGTWYPDRGAQFATYDVTFRYPKNLDLVSAGSVTEDRTEGETRITRRVPEGRIRLLAFNLGVYERKLVERGGIQIEVSANREVEDALRYRPPDATLPADVLTQGSRIRRLPRGLADSSAQDNGELNPQIPAVVNPANQLARVAEDMAGAMEFYRTRFGEPPMKRIEVSPVPGRFGQGFAGMIYLSTLSYLPVTARPISLMPTWQQVFYGELLRAHEAAHQWWGNIVTAGAYRHEWLMEALANYSAMLFLESKSGPKLVDTLLSQYKIQLLTKGLDGETAESEGPIVQGRRLENSNNPNAWTAIAYGKGTWIIHMLRRRMGDAQFTKMLAELRRRYEWKTIDTEQFRLLCAEFVPAGSPDPRLENFFDQWVYGTGIPTLKMSYSVKGKPGAYKLSGTITQTDVSDDFSVAVPVEIQTGRGKVVKQVQTSSDPVPFSIAVTVPNAKAVLDPASGVLRR